MQAIQYLLFSSIVTKTTLGSISKSNSNLKIPARRLLEIIENEYEYYLFTDETGMNKTQAQASCESAGMSLPSINDYSTNSEILSLLSSTDGNGWLGLTDAASEGNWMWDDGRSLEYTHWSPGEPNNVGNEDCAEMITDTSASYRGYWNDLPCDRQLFQWVCIKEISFNTSFAYYCNNYNYIPFSNDSGILWSDAELYCNNLGSNLASIHSSEENTMLTNLIYDWIGNNRIVWIGLNDINNEGYYEWSDGSDYTDDYSYSNWGYGKPDNDYDYEDVVYIYNGEWNDYYSTYKASYFVCNCNNTNYDYSSSPNDDSGDDTFTNVIVYLLDNSYLLMIIIIGIICCCVCTLRYAVLKSDNRRRKQAKEKQTEEEEQQVPMNNYNNYNNNMPHNGAGPAEVLPPYAPPSYIQASVPSAPSAPSAPYAPTQGANDQLYYAGDEGEREGEGARVQAGIGYTPQGVTNR